MNNLLWKLTIKKIYKFLYVILIIKLTRLALQINQKWPRTNQIRVKIIIIKEEKEATTQQNVLFMDKVIMSLFKCLF
jgi:hypothetical protein